MNCIQGGVKLQLLQTFGTSQTFQMAKKSLPDSSSHAAWIHKDRVYFA